jgi:hypothetical protein
MVLFPFYPLAIVINDPLGCDPFGRGHNLDCHLPFFSFFVAIVGDILNHGHDLGLCGSPPISFLVATTNDLPSCDLFCCGHDLDRCLPSRIFCLQLLEILLIMVMVMIFIFLLLTLAIIVGDLFGCGSDIDIHLPFLFSCLELLVILLNLKP